MKVYTKHGDKGMTTLASGMQIFKSDERIAVLGDVDELTSQIGLARVLVQDERLRVGLLRVQRTLTTLMVGIADARSTQHRLPAEETAFLETEIDAMGEQLPEAFQFVTPGDNELSARLDVARTVARRAERGLVAMDRKYSAQPEAKTYINRLSDYLYTAARYAALSPNPAQAPQAAPPVPAAPVVPVAAPQQPAATPEQTGGLAMQQTDDVVQAVLRQLGECRSIDLPRAKRLVEAAETCARQQGKKAVIAVCNAQGNPVAVHVMDGAYLVSFEVAVKKAYTAAALKMSTLEVSRLAQPGGTFYGLANLEKMVIFGGGVPVTENGCVIGGLGISGGTGEEDHALCEAALRAYSQS